MKREELLKALFAELEGKAYNAEYHNYYYKEANQVIRAFFERTFPPAEGAEAFVKSKGLNLDYVKGIQLFLNPKYTVIDLMTEFAAQPPPTAEGAEEIEAELRGYARDIVRLHKPIMEVSPQLAMDSIGNDLVKMFNRLAQRLADKMVSERCKKCKYRGLPDSIQEALNSGDGVYRP